MGKKQKRHTAEQIIRLLREAETSEKTIQEFVREKGISDQSFYRWKKKYGGMNTDEAKRLKMLEAENSRLKKIVAERDLEIDVMKEIARKKW